MALKPPVEVPQGAIRLNTDSQKLEFYAQDQWWEMATDVPTLNGGARGLFCGGWQNSPSPNVTVNNIDYITIATAGNATDFGDLNDTLYEGGATSSNTRGVTALGYSEPATVDVIEYVTIPVASNSTDFGDLTQGDGEEINHMDHGQEQYLLVEFLLLMMLNI